MTKYLVTMNTIGYGEFGNPRQELLCEEVDSSGLYILLADLAAIAEGAVLKKPSQASYHHG